MEEIMQLNLLKTTVQWFLRLKKKAVEEPTTRTRLKMLTPKQLLQRLRISLAQIKAGNNSKNLLNEIRQIVYSLYQSKKALKSIQ